jgi:hypothetical protein
MAKTNMTKVQKTKTSWLKLVLELIVYYYRSHEDMRYVEGVYNDYITNYILPYVSKKLDFISGQFVDDFSVDDIEFRNIASGYFVLARQKSQFVSTLDSLNRDLRMVLSAHLD